MERWGASVKEHWSLCGKSRLTRYHSRCLHPRKMYLTSYEGIFLALFWWDNTVQSDHGSFSSPYNFLLHRTPEVGPCASQIGWCQKYNLLLHYVLDRLRLILKNSFNNIQNVKKGAQKGNTIRPGVSLKYFKCPSSLIWINLSMNPFAKLWTT